MYFPYLYGKSNELYALDELSEFLVRASNVTPIIEPVNTNSTTINKLSSLNEAHIPFVLIVNPVAGDLVGASQEIYSNLVSQLNADNMSLGFNITLNTCNDDVSSFISSNPNHNLSFIHQDAPISESEAILDTINTHQDRISYQIFIDGKTSELYKRSFQHYSRVLVRDDFNKAQRNSDYPEEQFFSDHYVTYTPGYEGFGDFQLIGQGIADGGGPAHAVTLHLSVIPQPGREIRVRHFISNDTEGPENPGGKYLQALQKLVNYVDENEIDETHGIQDFRETYNSSHYPGLGKSKRFSIKHHIELISSNI